MSNEILGNNGGAFVKTSRTRKKKESWGRKDGPLQEEGKTKRAKRRVKKKQGTYTKNHN